MVAQVITAPLEPFLSMQSDKTCSTGEKKTPSLENTALAPSPNFNHHNYMHDLNLYTNFIYNSNI